MPAFNRVCVLIMLISFTLCVLNSFRNIFQANKVIKLTKRQHKLQTDYVVLCANFGSIDRTPPSSQLENYFYFDESSVEFPRYDMNPRLRSKYFKTRGHDLFPSAETIVWSDSSIELKSGVVGWLKSFLGNHDAVFFQHPDRFKKYISGKL
jgi:hypothetical protein